MKSKQDKSRLLWSKAALEGELDYYEVELLPGNVEDDISYIEPSKSLTCHICNIDVPEIYFKLHTKSQMHQNYKTLTEKVLQNVSKQINIEVEYTDTNNLTDKFYCETCCKVVSVKNKQKHNKSTHHFKFKEYAKQIDVFLSIYSKRKEYEDKKRIHRDSTDSKYDDNDSDSSESSSEEVYNKQKFYRISTAEKEAIKGSIIMSCTEDTNMQHDMKYVTPKQSMQINLEDTVIIETPKGYKEIVKVMNYHGYVEINNTYFCHLCNMWMDNDTQGHSNSEDHLRNVAQPINDDFTRELVHKKMKHCILCNALITPDSDHATVNPNHKKYTSKIKLLQNKTDKHKKEKPDKTFCYDCNKYIDKDNYIFHTSTKKHIKKHEKMTVKNIIKSCEPEVVVAEDTVTTSVGTVQDMTIFCNICEVHVAVGDIQNHEDEMAHKLAKGLKTDKEYLDNISLDLHNKPIPSTSKAMFAPAPIIKTSVELKIPDKLSEYKKQMTELSSTWLKCLICILKVPNSDNSIIKHIEGLNHTNVLKLNYLRKIAPDHYYCNLCKLSVQDVVEHVDTNINHIFNKTWKGPIDCDKVIHYVYTDTLNTSPVAVVYRQIYNYLLKKHKITRLHHSVFHCSACNIRLTRVSEISHMLGKSHASRLKTKMS